MEKETLKKAIREVLAEQEKEKSKDFFELIDSILGKTTTATFEGSVTLDNTLKEVCDIVLGGMAKTGGNGAKVAVEIDGDHSAIFTVYKGLSFEDAIKKAREPLL